jgi:hypothetical protein
MRAILLAYVWEDRAIPWAGIAAVLAGTGSLLSGIAALKMARRKGRDEANSKQADSPVSGEPDAGGSGGSSHNDGA